MFHVVILWSDAELGEGFGDTLEYAEQEAIASVDAAYAVVREEWKFEVSEESA